MACLLTNISKKREEWKREAENRARMEEEEEEESRKRPGSEESNAALAEPVEKTEPLQQAPKRRKINIEAAEELLSKLHGPT